MKIRTQSIYEKRSTDDLRAMLSRKKIILAELQKVDGFFTRIEVGKLTNQIRKIEVELTARFYQQTFPLE